MTFRRRHLKWTFLTRDMSVSILIELSCWDLVSEYCRFIFRGPDNSNTTKDGTRPRSRVHPLHSRGSHVVKVLGHDVSGFVTSRPLASCKSSLEISSDVIKRNLDSVSSANAPCIHTRNRHLPLRHSWNYDYEIRKGMVYWCITHWQ